MATGKRYYWLKLKESFMTSDTVDFLMSQKDGANYVVLYQMLCLKTINTEGRLSRTIGEIVIPYDVSKIQRDCKWFSTDTIRVALELYKRFGLVYEDQDGTLVLANHDEMVGSETDWAKQKRNQALSKQCVPSLESGNERGKEVESSVENLHTDIRDKILEIRDRETKNTNIAQKSADDEANEKRFSEFWEAYGNKKGKKNAFKAFSKIHPDEELFQQIMSAVEKYHQSHKWREGYRKEPATWLNGECWNDEYNDESEAKSNGRYSKDRRKSDEGPRTVYDLKPNFI